MLKIKVLSSGSNGNCTVILNGQDGIMIDAGISCKRIRECLTASGLSSVHLHGIFVTHEHSDHIFGLPVLAKKLNLPVFGSRETLEKLTEMNIALASLADRMIPVSPYEPVPAGPFLCTPIETSHDAAHPFAYRVEAGDEAFAVFTDSGVFNQALLPYFSDLDGILLESNHDVRMLECGSYPFVLKRRILGPFGHLSNEDAADVLERIYTPKLKLVLLGHLSEENNLPDIARMTTEQKLKEMGIFDSVRLFVCERGKETEIFDLNA